MCYGALGTIPLFWKWEFSEFSQCEQCPRCSATCYTREYFQTRGNIALIVALNDSADNRTGR